MPKLIELADEIMRFGDTALQDEFIAMAQAADFFLFSLRAQLKAFMAEVKRALERSVSKDVSHLTKRLEAQTVTFTQCRTLLHFIQMLCEGHNGRAQDYLRNQDELGLGRKAKKINLVSEVAHHISPASPLHLPCISPASPLYLASPRLGGGALLPRGHPVSP